MLGPCRPKRFAASAWLSPSGLEPSRSGSQLLKSRARGRSRALRHVIQRDLPEDQAQVSSVSKTFSAFKLKLES